MPGPEPDNVRARCSGGHNKVEQPRPRCKARGRPPHSVPHEAQGLRPGVEEPAPRDAPRRHGQRGHQHVDCWRASRPGQPGPSQPLSFSSVGRPSASAGPAGRTNDSAWRRGAGVNSCSAPTQGDCNADPDIIDLRRALNGTLCGSRSRSVGRPSLGVCRGLCLGKKLPFGT